MVKDECNEGNRDDCTDEKGDTVDVCEASPSADCDLGVDTATNSSVLLPGAPLTASDEWDDAAATERWYAYALQTEAGATSLRLATEQLRKARQDCSTPKAVADDCARQMSQAQRNLDNLGWKRDRLPGLAKASPTLLPP